MIINGPSHYQYKLPRRPVGPEEKFGFGTLLAFFTTKVIRGGPKFLLHLITAVVLFLLILKLVSQECVRHNLWSWHTAKSGDNSSGSGTGTASDGSVPGGLRIVVFGGHDVANPGRVPGPEYTDIDKRSWTELLCAELKCSSYLSFVPTDAPSRTMISNQLFAASVDRVRNATAWSNGPGMDYSFLPEHYPVPWNIPDLEQQVTAFLSLPKPQNSPTETLWVFSFGTWEVWSMAAEPRELSIPAIDGMASQVVAQVERIYQSALNESSIAWSDPNQLVRSAGLDKTTNAGSPEKVDFDPEEGDKGLKADEARSANETNHTIEGKQVPPTAGHFRILIPKLFDPSLTPGWRTTRPDLPAAHSKAEQMRNAAALTNHWNMQLHNFVHRWVRTPDPRPKVDGEVDHTGTSDSPKKPLTGKEAIAAYKASLQNANAKPESKVSSKSDASKGKQSAKLPQPVQPRGAVEVATKPEADGITVVVEEEKPEAAPQPDTIQRPQRDGIMYDMNDRLTELIIDRQFRNTGLKDSLGVGTKPTQDGFLEVKKPCTEDLFDGEIRHYEHREPEPELPAIRGRPPVPTNDALPPNVTRPEICEAPQEHLFFTPFTVSPRAIGMVARWAADMVRNNETVRARLAQFELKPAKQKPGRPVGFF